MDVSLQGHAIQGQALTPAQAKQRLLDWAHSSDADRAARSMSPLAKASLGAAGGIVAGAILARGGGRIGRVATLALLVRGAPLIFPLIAKSITK